MNRRQILRIGLSAAFAATFHSERRLSAQISKVPTTNEGNKMSEPIWTGKKTESELIPVGASVTAVTLAGAEAVQVIKDAAITKDDEPTFGKFKTVRFKDGIIEAKVRSRLRENAPEHARGFIGIAFRINEDNTKFECIYIRPVNARVDQQLRRNRSTQYFSFPDFKFDRLRKEKPGEYESYADMAMDEWIDFKLLVHGTQAKLYLHGNEQPVLVVNDLKHGSGESGAIGLWVDIGTEGYFTDVRVTVR